VTAQDDNPLVDGRTIEDVMREDAENRERQERGNEDALLDAYVDAHFPLAKTPGKEAEKPSSADGEDRMVESYVSQHLAA
jgi:hypothetical protein